MGERINDPLQTAFRNSPGGRQTLDLGQIRTGWPQSHWVAKPPNASGGRTGVRYWDAR